MIPSGGDATKSSILSCHPERSEGSAVSFCSSDEPHYRSLATLGTTRPEKSSRQENKVTASHTEAISPVSGKIQSKLASAGRVLRLVSNRQRLMLATGIAILLCLTGAGCDGFFISPSIGSIYITPSAATISASCTQQLTATAKYSDGSTGTISGSSVGWSSSNDAVATITPGGLVMAVATGTAIMTVSDQGVSATATVTVTVENLNSIIITTIQGSTSPLQTNVTLPGAPNTLQFYAYANGNSSQDITQAVTWKSSDVTKATISSGLSSGGNGLVTSVAAGNTVITASTPASTCGTSTNGATSNSITVTVTP